MSVRRSPWELARIRGEPTGRAVFIDTGSDCCAHDASRSRGKGIAQRRRALRHEGRRERLGRFDPWLTYLHRNPMINYQKAAPARAARDKLY